MEWRKNQKLNKGPKFELLPPKKNRAKKDPDIDNIEPHTP
jgi:hypothetical protein